ncbi:unnamed protein product [Caenorhabditis angaria]|uniref:MSP domain-containing protein n=1 Tax=Caenorhabditis angaria TaxID=860376 RepID=A0A9P1J074_9PELO|nr:unnamed protein product [Caenorhabditis angaria]
MAAANEESVPVFVSSTELIFRINEKTPAKLFTLYNPYSYPISYKILCTATRNYTVSESTGSLLADCCKDIVVRSIQRSQVGNLDRLKIEMMRKGSSKVIGSREINLRTVPGDYIDNVPQEENDRMRHMPAMTASVTSVEKKDNHSATWAYLIAGIFCAVALVCPTAGDPTSTNSSIPPLLHITLPQKLVAAYILGIVTILILRPL